jgi:arylsulfatase A-like enzyme
MDLTATILAISGATVPADAKLEGINLIPLLTKGAKPLSRTLYWRVNFTGISQRAVRDGNWKLLLDGNERLHLFDLMKDPGERNDLTAANIAIVRKLRQQILDWEKDVDTEAKSAPR